MDIVEKLYIVSNSLDNLAIKHVESRLTKDEKQALDIVEEEMKILPNGSIELPLIWKRENGQLPHLPNNFAMIYKRQVAQENKLKKNPELLKALMIISSSSLMKVTPDQQQSMI